MRMLDSERAKAMASLLLGLTKLYNRLHDPADSEPLIVQLRQFHTELDYAVCAAYGWTDLALDYGFHETDEGIRWTVAGAVIDEMLERLLQLNHQRHAEETAAILMQGGNGGKVHEQKAGRR
jgi:hypothetical protein